jgi:hypothetical protein
VRSALEGEVAGATSDAVSVLPPAIAEREVSAVGCVVIADVSRQSLTNELELSMAELPYRQADVVIGCLLTCVRSVFTLYRGKKAKSKNGRLRYTQVRLRA